MKRPFLLLFILLALAAGGASLILYYRVCATYQPWAFTLFSILWTIGMGISGWRIRNRSHATDIQRLENASAITDMAIDLLPKVKKSLHACIFTVKPTFLIDPELDEKYSSQFNVLALDASKQFEIIVPAPNVAVHLFLEAIMKSNIIQVTDQEASTTTQKLREFLVQKLVDEALTLYTWFTPAKNTEIIYYDNPYSLPRDLNFVIIDVDTHSASCLVVLSPIDQNTLGVYSKGQLAPLKKEIFTRLKATFLESRHPQSLYRTIWRGIAVHIDEMFTKENLLDAKQYIPRRGSAIRELVTNRCEDIFHYILADLKKEHILDQNTLDLLLKNQLITKDEYNSL